jgi:hypothetical protein
MRSQIANAFWPSGRSKNRVSWRSRAAPGPDYLYSPEAISLSQ